MVATANNVTYIPVTKVVGVRTDASSKPVARVAAYCRVSTDREEQESSFDAQVEHYRQYISSKEGWSYAGIYADEGISGLSTRNRDQFNKMVDDCMAGKIDIVITKSVSRFARNTLDCLEHVRKLKSRNVAVIFEKENINTLDTKGEMFLTLMASLAQQESESIGRNVSMGIQYRFQQGKVMVNHNRFLGYTKKDGQLVVDEQEAKTVRRIFREYLSGCSCIRIAKGLEADGVRNGAGNTKWWDSNITTILTNEKYMGDALLQKTFTVDTLEKRRSKNRGDRPQYYVEGALEPIISKEVFLLVQDEMARRSSMSSEGGACLHRAYNALSGLVVCGQCGAPFRRVKWNNRGCRSVVWRCRTRLDQKDGCSARTMKEEEIRDAVLEAVNSIFSDKAMIEPAIRANLEQTLIDTTDEEAKGIIAELKSLQTRIINDRQNERALGDRIIALKRRLDEIHTRKAKEKEMKDLSGDLMSCFGEGKIEECTDDLVRTFVKQIRVFSDRIAITFRTGVEVEVS